MASTYIALLRGVNVSGSKPMKMAELKELCERSLSLRRVQTYIQSGNVVFDALAEADGDTGAQERQLASMLTSAIKKRFGYEVSVVVLSVGRLARVLEGSPYADKGLDVKALHVTFLGEAATASASQLERLSGLDRGTAEYVLRGDVFYLHCPDGYGRCKLANPTLERVLGACCTTRNWNTLNALLRMAR